MRIVFLKIFVYITNGELCTHDMVQLPTCEGDIRISQNLMKTLKNHISWMDYPFLSKFWMFIAKKIFYINEFIFFSEYSVLLSILEQQGGIDRFTSDSHMYGCFFPRELVTSYFINLYLAMVFQYLESFLHTLVVATSDKPWTSFQVVRNFRCWNGMHKISEPVYWHEPRLVVRGLLKKCQWPVE